MARLWDLRSLVLVKLPKLLVGAIRERVFVALIHDAICTLGYNWVEVVDAMFSGYSQLL